MWQTEVTMDIATPRESVYRYLADFKRHSEWSSGVAELELAGGGNIGVGAEFKAVEKIPMKFISFSRITALEAPRRIAWESWDGRAFRVQWDFEVNPVASGTRLVQRARFRPVSLFGAVMLNLVRRWQIPKENRRSLARIKAILENGATEKA